MELGLFLVISLALRVSATSKREAEIEELLRDLFRRLPQDYEDLYLPVDDCAEAYEPSIYVYGVPNMLTVASGDNAVKCSLGKKPGACKVECVIRWLRAVDNSTIVFEEIFFKNREVSIDFVLFNEVPQLTPGIRNRIAREIQLLDTGELESYRANSLLKCAQHKFMNYLRVLEDALLDLSPKPVR